jgi:MSHA biogenesis protein MshQ
LQYDFSAKESGPLTLALRATEDLSGGVSSSSGTGTEPSLVMRSGRMLIESRIGSAGASLAMPLRVETWSGSSWVLATGDSCTSLSALSVAMSGRVNGKGASASWTNSVSVGSFVGGRGTLTLGATNPVSVGSMQVALNLGSTSTDRACLPPTRPSSTGANLPWLRSRFGSQHCDGGWANDPSARASFGLINAESQKRIHERQLY